MDSLGPALVVAPLKGEADALCRRLTKKGFASNPAQIGALTCSVIPALDIMIGVGGVGKHSSPCRHSICSIAAPRRGCSSASAARAS